MIEVHVTKRTETRVSYWYESRGRTTKSVVAHKKLDHWVAIGGAVIVEDVI